MSEQNQPRVTTEIAEATAASAGCLLLGLGAIAAPLVALSLVFNSAMLSRSLATYELIGGIPLWVGLALIPAGVGGWFLLRKYMLNSTPWFVAVSISMFFVAGSISDSNAHLVSALWFVVAVAAMVANNRKARAVPPPAPAVQAVLEAAAPADGPAAVPSTEVTQPKGSRPVGASIGCGVAIVGAALLVLGFLQIMFSAFGEVAYMMAGGQGGSTQVQGDAAFDFMFWGGVLAVGGFIAFMSFRLKK